MNTTANNQSAMSHAGVIALTDKVATAGAIVWWRLSGLLNLEALQQAWEAEGLPEKWLPEPVGPSVASRRALAAQREAHKLVRSLPQGGVALVSERAITEENDLAYDTDVKVSVNKVGHMVIEPADHPLRDRLLADFERFQGALTQADISVWLTRLMDRVEAVALRETGGVYFVPRYTLETWERVVRALRASSGHKVLAAPAMRSDEAVEAIEDAVVLEAEQSIKRFEDELAAGTLGKRALENRAAGTQSLESKLARYEEIIGKRQEVLREKLEAVRANLTIAITLAEANEAAAE